MLPGGDRLLDRFRRKRLLRAVLLLRVIGLRYLRLEALLVLVGLGIQAGIGGLLDDAQKRADAPEHGDDANCGIKDGKEARRRVVGLTESVDAIVRTIADGLLSVLFITRKRGKQNMRESTQRGS